MLNEGQTTTIKKDQICHSKDFFIGDHIVPIKMIEKELLTLKSPNHNNVQNILNNMKVAYITTDEDRRINRLNPTYKSNRNLNYKEVIKTIYKKAGIVISSKVIKGY